MKWHDSVLLRFLAIALLGVGIGLVGALAALAFVQAISWIHQLLFAEAVHGWSKLLRHFGAPILGGLIVGLLLYWRRAKFAPLGPTQVIESVQLRQPMPPFRSGLRSTLGAVVSIGCGAPVGQLGPLIYLGAMVGQLAATLRLPVAELRTCATACGVAATIALVFGAPLSGVLLVHESLLRRFSLQTAAPVSLAAVTSYLVGDELLGHEAMLQVSKVQLQLGAELLLFVLFGLSCALVAMAYMWAIRQGVRLRHAMPLPAWLRPAVAGTAVGLMAWWLPDLVQLNAQTIKLDHLYILYDGWEMLLLALLKIALTALCLGLGFAGGVFSPALIVGLLCGGAFWWLLQLLGIPNSGYDVYALGGMMAVTSPVIGAPFATILIVFELTQNYQLTLAAMVAVTFANLVVTRLMGRSLFDIQLAERGVELHKGGELAVLKSRRLKYLASNDYLALTVDTSPAGAAEAMRNSGQSEALLIDADGNYRGVVALLDVLASPSARLEALARQDWPVLYAGTSLWHAMNQLRDFIGNQIPLLERTEAGEKIIGVVTEAGIIRAYVEIVEELRAAQHRVL